MFLGSTVNVSEKFCKLYAYKKMPKIVTINLIVNNEYFT